MVLAVTLDLAVDPLGAPVRYAELAALLGVEIGDRAPATAVREAVLELRRGKGMVLDDSDHDTWSAGSFFTNPILSAAEAETAARGGAALRAAGRIGQDVSGVAHLARRIPPWVRRPPRSTCGTVHQALPGADQPRWCHG